MIFDTKRFLLARFGSKKKLYLCMPKSASGLCHIAKLRKKITLLFAYIRKKVVPLQALQMTKVLHISKKCSTFATEIEMTDVKSANVLVRKNIKTLWQTE